MSKKSLSATTATSIIEAINSNLTKDHPKRKKLRGIINNLETRLKKTLTDSIHVFKEELETLRKSKLIPDDILAGI